MQSKTCSKGGSPCRYTLIVAGLILLTGLAPALAADSPNINIILVDDMGYGDLGCFGNPTIRTPSLDRMASEGQKWTSFYAGALAQNTLVVFTSDNGPWAAFREHGGSSGLLRDQKGTTWEGGLRVPAIFWWPGRVRPSVVTGIGSAMDLFTTAIRLAGGEVPGDRTIDGVDLSPALFGSGSSPRETLLYYRGRRVWTVRKGPFKAHFFTKPEWGHNLVEKQHDPPLLFHLDRDPSERFDISKHHPEVIAEIREIRRKHQEDLVPGEDLLVKRLPPEK